MFCCLKSDSFLTSIRVSLDLWLAAVYDIIYIYIYIYMYICMCTSIYICISIYINIKLGVI